LKNTRKAPLTSPFRLTVNTAGFTRVVGEGSVVSGWVALMEMTVDSGRITVGNSGGRTTVPVRVSDLSTEPSESVNVADTDQSKLNDGLGGDVGMEFSPVVWVKAGAVARVKASRHNDKARDFGCIS
jgi:hypothetical protein